MKQTIGIFFGSRSAEHDVSIITAQFVASVLRKLGYPMVPVYVGKRGEWYVAEELGLLKTFAAGTEMQPAWGRYYLDLERSRGKMVFKQSGWFGKTLTVDLVFPTFHGTFGEDGTFQGLCEILNVPYVGCGVAASAIAMDKQLTKAVVAQAGLPVATEVSVTKGEWGASRAQVLQHIRERVPFPAFVKPVHLGSSIGISKVATPEGEDLGQQLDVAFHYDSKVIVEQGVQNLMDVTCCVLGNDQPKASELQESVFGADLLDFDAKYLDDGGTQTGQLSKNVVIPARLPEHVTMAIKEAAKKVYRALGCSGIARVDFLYDQKSMMFYVSEVNPLPGTLYNHLWNRSGVSNEQLVEQLITLANERHTAEQELTRTFNSAILTSLKGGKLGPKLNR